VVAVSDGMRCPDCDETHDDWSDAGTAATPPGYRGQYDLWDCERCGFTLEGVRL